MKRRVVITGVGVVTSLGVGAEEFWKSIKEGKCGIDKVTKFDTTDFPTKVASFVKDFEPTDFIDKKEARRMDRYTHFASAASKMAVNHSKLNIDKVDKDRFGVVIGSGIGGIETLENQHEVLLSKGPGRISPFFIPMMIPNMAAGQIAIQFGAKGFSECVVTACATSTNAVGDAFRLIQGGYADVILTGGAEAAVTPLAFAGFCSMGAMSKKEDPNRASIPFDAERDGFVMGEGGGVLLLEELEHALKRGADIIAEIIGYGCNNDAFHITAPSEGGEGAAKCMKLALEDAGISPEEVSYINAHGTGTPYNDKSETQAIKTVFGDYAYKLPVSSTKSMTGHLLGAAGAVEAIICALAVKDGFIPPTINYKVPDPECDLDYVTGTGRKADLRVAISNSFGFGGHNATLVIKKYE